VTLVVIITCVNYADFLRLTLPAAKRAFGSVTVLTSPQDLQTRFVCESIGAKPYLTDVWQEYGATFNKSAAISECLQVVTQNDDDCWVLLMDADVLLPDGVRIDLPALDRSTLYSVPRRLCENESDWISFRAGRMPWGAFPLDIPPVIGGKVWGGVPTANPAGLMGYFQLWHLSCLGGIRIMPLSRNAASYDISFALRFADNKRVLLPFEVLHLGPIRVNWDGRNSASWDSPPHNLDNL
jgi:hypothetical protein